MVTDLRAFIAASIPTMLFFGMRHALDVDHITAIDNLVRMHKATKKARWVGTGFSAGHTVSIFLELLLVVYVVGSAIGGIEFLGGVIGAVALATIGAVNIYSMRRWGRTGSAILASKVVSRTHFLGPIGSATITGLIFGIGFDTATQISALTLSAVASATLGVQIALTLAVFFAIGLILVDSLDSILVRSAFSRILKTKAFVYVSYGLSAVALGIAALESYSVITNKTILPEFIGPVLAVLIISTAFGYGFATRNRVPRITSEEPLTSTKPKEEAE